MKSDSNSIPNPLKRDSNKGNEKEDSEKIDISFLHTRARSTIQKNYFETQELSEEFSKMDLDNETREIDQLIQECKEMKILILTIQ